MLWWLIQDCIYIKVESGPLAWVVHSLVDYVKALRKQALALLQSAWENGGLVSATRSSPRKRGLAEKDQPKPCKRRKLPV